MEPPSAPALKEVFNEALFRSVAREMTLILPRFDSKKFLNLALADLDALSLLQRIRRLTKSIHEVLPHDYRRNVAVLQELAPCLEPGLVPLFLPDYVGLFGQHDFDFSMEALRFLTSFGSSEFAVREFIRLDQNRALATMEKWSHHENEHVRRLASEGSRPRLPWSFHLETLRRDPSPVLPILENLRNDESRYVRKSVANHLNDLTKDHPDRVLDLLTTWPRDLTHPFWIVRHGLRTLIKQGNQRALFLIGATAQAQVSVNHFAVTPEKISLGEKISLTLHLRSTAREPQRWVIDYAVHYPKKSGFPFVKVFKWKELDATPGELISLTRSQWIKNFTTRKHHPGFHAIEVLINGTVQAQSGFHLRRGSGDHPQISEISAD